MALTLMLDEERTRKLYRILLPHVIELVKQRKVQAESSKVVLETADGRA